MKKRSLLLFPLVFVLSFCADKVMLNAQSFYHFNTIISLKSSEQISVETADKIDTYFDKYHKLSNQNEDSKNIVDIYDINHSNDVFTVSPELYNLLKFVEDNKAKFNGYFNPFAGKLSNLWKKVIREKKLPEEAKINEYIEEMENTHLLLLEENKVRRIGKATIDLGAVAKGYATANIASVLADNNIKNYLLDSGSSSMLMTSKNDKPFKIAVSDLKDKVLSLRDCALGTSSISKQSVKIEGKIYSHIVNPYDGSAISNYDAVVVKGKDAGLLDMASTAFMMMDLDDIKSIATQLNFEILVIKNGEELYKSEGLKYA